MKSTDLEKNKALKLVGKMKQSGSRFAADTGTVTDRREQRKLDQAQGLISFPVKIQGTLVEELRKRAAAEDRSTNELIGELLERALKQ